MARITAHLVSRETAHTMARINIWKTLAGNPPRLPSAHTMARIFENRRRRTFDADLRANGTVWTQKATRWAFGRREACPGRFEAAGVLETPTRRAATNGP